VTDQTGVTEFIQKCIARDRAWAAELPDRPRSLLERTLRLLEHVVQDHEPDPHLRLGREPLCVGCVEDVPWPCDFTLHAAAIWRDEQGFRTEWRDALDPLHAVRGA
jgi:hypothetical protein